MNQPRVHIRPPRPSDRDAFLAAVSASVDLHTPWVAPPSTPEAWDTWLEKMERPENESRLICLEETGDLVGVVNINSIIRGVFQNAFLGFYAFVPHAGRGLMREGLEQVIEECFTSLELHRLEANIQPGNARSIALAKGCGFTKEGYSRRYLHIDGEWRDHERWALLAEDWR